MKRKSIISKLRAAVQLNEITGSFKAFTGFRRMERQNGVVRLRLGSGRAAGARGPNPLQLSKESKEKTHLQRERVGGGLGGAAAGAAAGAIPSPVESF